MPILPDRKRLRLKEYDYSQNGYYFLTICTKDRRPVLSKIVFDSRQEASVQLSAYGTAAEVFIKTFPGIDKYVIMPNHIHMIIHKTNGKSLFSDVRSFKGLVSKAVGNSIWQDSYYEHIIRNEKDYQEKWRYIDENPLKWAEDEYAV